MGWAGPPTGPSRSSASHPGVDAGTAPSSPGLRADETQPWRLRAPPSPSPRGVFTSITSFPALGGNLTRSIEGSVGSRKGHRSPLTVVIDHRPRMIDHRL